MQNLLHWLLFQVVKGSGIRIAGFFADEGKTNSDSQLVLPPSDARGRNCIAVCIVEKADRLLLELAAQGRLSELDLVVVDELHHLGQKLRGDRLELFLAKMVYLNRFLPTPVQVQLNLCGSDFFELLLNDFKCVLFQLVAMSATLSDVRIFDWLNAERYLCETRPVKLTELVKHGSVVYDASWDCQLQLKSPASSPQAEQLQVRLIFHFCQLFFFVSVFACIHPLFYFCRRLPKSCIPISDGI
jgi:hypothetical protein